MCPHFENFSRNAYEEADMLDLHAIAWKVFEMLLWTPFVNFMKEMGDESIDYWFSHDLYIVQRNKDNNCWRPVRLIIWTETIIK